MNTNFTNNTLIQSTRVFFYGCWNRDDCEPGHKEGLDFRQQVIDDVKAKHKANPFQAGIIAGDNVYPWVSKNIKGKKIKTYYRSTIERGFNALKSVGVPLHFVLGNHDVEKKSILSAEKEIAKDSLKLDIVSYTDYTNVRFIFINTNVMQQVISGTMMNDPTLQIDHRFSHLINELETVLRNSKQKWNIIVGHDPLFGLKDKDGKDVVESYENHLVFDVIAKYSTKNIIYMCADIHNFQALLVNYRGAKLPIIVCGTGGARGDNLVDVKEKHSNSTIKIDNDKTGMAEIKVIGTKEEFGFCEIDIFPNTVNITYNQVCGPTDTYVIQSNGNYLEFQEKQYNTKYAKGQSDTNDTNELKCLLDVPKINCEEVSKNVVLSGGGTNERRKYNGRSYKVRQGTRGGRYIIVNGKKIYV
jgi:Calcineurin-like phosphoesterase